MSSISTLSSAIQQSPKQRILDSISAGVGTGSISKTDQTALDNAVGDIDTSLTGSSQASTSGPPDPAQIKAKIDGLIDNEVTSGKLTSDQASTLKQILGQSGGHHTHRAHGQLPGPPPTDSTNEPSSSDDSTSSSSGGSSVSDLLANFLKDLQSSQATASGYGATGSSGSGSAANPLIFNFSA